MGKNITNVTVAFRESELEALDRLVEQDCSCRGAVVRKAVRELYLHTLFLPRTNRPQLPEVTLPAPAGAAEAGKGGE